MLKFIIYFIVTLILLIILMPKIYPGALQSFSSDACSLFPNGSLTQRNLWCDCCFNHDVAYWKGGSSDERLAADKALRQCVLDKTDDLILAELMYSGVRSGGSEFYPTWYRWGYGWKFGRGYEPLTPAEQRQSKRLLKQYFKSGSSYVCPDP